MKCEIRKKCVKTIAHYRYNHTINTSSTHHQHIINTSSTLHDRFTLTMLYTSRHHLNNEQVEPVLREVVQSLLTRAEQRNVDVLQ
jgi:hypothetical protein